MTKNLMSLMPILFVISPAFGVSGTGVSEGPSVRMPSYDSIADWANQRLQKLRADCIPISGQNITLVGAKGHDNTSGFIYSFSTTCNAAPSSFQIETTFGLAPQPSKLISIAARMHGGTSTEIACAKEIKKKALEKAKSEGYGSCHAGEPTLTSAVELRDEYGSIGLSCTRHISRVSVVSEPVSYLFSLRTPFSTVALNCSEITVLDSNR